MPAIQQHHLLHLVAMSRCAAPPVRHAVGDHLAHLLGHGNVVVQHALADALVGALFNRVALLFGALGLGESGT